LSYFSVALIFTPLFIKKKWNGKKSTLILRRSFLPEVNTGQALKEGNAGALSQAVSRREANPNSYRYQSFLGNAQKIYTGKTLDFFQILE
jgi:hypothetical protein